MYSCCISGVIFPLEHENVYGFPLKLSNQDRLPNDGMEKNPYAGTYEFGWMYLKKGYVIA